MSSKVVAIRGATTVDENTKKDILTSTRELLTEISKRNQLNKEDIISIFFTVTQDLDAAFPAQAARELGWDLIPLICANEIDVPGAISKCIRVLIHINSNSKLEEIEHVYLNDAKKLRPDLAN
ncbi:chorismate mutase [Sporohalobacter salinus]|uniref:chorismate mutase n=1 Tax=Sporohalobacter salinus TaxID=1494606 RepID=UPI00195F7DB8|nr:chorismate mutase [Sporohalobacter salinus]MBM7623831.1 chorismate mutase [Sporohalobacter salinus]